MNSAVRTSALAGLILLASLSQSGARVATIEDSKQARSTYDNCVYLSAADQLKNRSVHDVGRVTENGFQACLSEERALRLFMRDVLLMTPKDIETGFLKIKISIKVKMRDIVANPASYTATTPPRNAGASERCQAVAKLLSSSFATPGQVAAGMEIGRNAGCFN